MLLMLMRNLPNCNLFPPRRAREEVLPHNINPRQVLVVVSTIQTKITLPERAFTTYRLHAKGTLLIFRLLPVTIC